MHSTRLMRARLNDRLARATRYPIAVIVAPAGFGKSVALRDFLLSSRLDAVRFDVGREQNTLLNFARGLAEAIASLVPTAAAAFPALQERALSAEDAPRLVADWFGEHFKRTVGTVVIDDLHFAAGDPGAVAFLVDLIDRTEHRVNWILATRSDAGLPIATWLAYGRMDAPIDQRDLQFTLDEAVAAAQAQQTSVEPSEVRSLCELTEGWPVALAIALRTHTQAADLRAAATREMIYRYLAEQVFGRVSESQRAFLLATSVFSGFDVTIAKALGGTVDFLAELRHGVAFISETEPGRYRYHDLFRDYLESELKRRGEEMWRNALSSAGRLLEERGELAEALALYAKAHDAAAVLAMVERDGFALFERGQSEELAAALAAIPEAQRLRSPAAVGLTATLDAARGHVEEASNGFVAAIGLADNDDLRLSFVHRYAIELMRQGRDCRSLLEGHLADESVAPALRMPLLGTLATAYGRAGEHDRAVETIVRALDLLAPSASDETRARLYQQAAYVYVDLPDYQAARRYARLAIDLALSRTLYDVAARAYSVSYVAAYEESGDPVACLTTLDRLVECARKGANRQTLLYGLMAAYGIEAERGNEAALDAIETQLGELPVTLAQNRSEVLLPSMALRAAWAGDFDRACTLLAQTSEPANEERRAERCSELALYAAAAARREEAEATFSAAVEALNRCERPTRRALRAGIFLVLVELLLGRLASANRRLAQLKRRLDSSTTRLSALAHAATMYHRLAVGNADRTLLAGALERLRAEQLGGFARLLESLPFPEAAQEASGYASLTATEREILGLLVAGASTKSMAVRTSRSPATIDTHIRSICKKLNCSGRRAAVAIATGSGWVQNESY